MTSEDLTKQRSDLTLNTLHIGMTEVIGRWTEGKEDCLTPIKNLLFFRREAPSVPCACTIEPSVLFVV